MFCNRVFVIFVWFLCSQERAYDEENKSKEESSFCSPIDSQMPALAAQFRNWILQSPGTYEDAVDTQQTIHSKLDCSNVARAGLLSASKTALTTKTCHFPGEEESFLQKHSKKVGIYQRFHQSGTGHASPDRVTPYAIVQATAAGCARPPPHRTSN